MSNTPERLDPERFAAHLKRLEASAKAETRAWNDGTNDWEDAHAAFHDEVSASTVLHLLDEMKANRALLDQIRDHVLNDRAHTHCPLRALLTKEA